MIKAIDTTYKGYRFRSRLEARWAVFFDTLKIRWEYEKEGFQFENGLRYLPDFFLPDLHIWAEVKPNHVYSSSWDVFPREEDQETLIKINNLVANSQQAAVLLTGPLELPFEWNIGYDIFGFGEMAPYLYFMPTEETESDHNGVYCDSPYRWCVCMKCGFSGIHWEGRADRLECGHDIRRSNNYLVDMAYGAARSARFEFGDIGTNGVIYAN